MHTFFGSGRVKADQLENVCAAIREFVPTMQAEEGTLEWLAYQQKDDPQRFVFFERYRDQAANNLHHKNPKLKILMDVLMAATEGEVFTGFFDEIAVLER